VPAQPPPARTRRSVLHHRRRRLNHLQPSFHRQPSRPPPPRGPLHSSVAFHRGPRVVASHPDSAPSPPGTGGAPNTPSLHPLRTISRSLAPQRRIGRRGRLRSPHSAPPAAAPTPICYVIPRPISLVGASMSPRPAPCAPAPAHRRRPRGDGESDARLCGGARRRHYGLFVGFEAARPGRTTPGAVARIPDLPPACPQGNPPRKPRSLVSRSASALAQRQSVSGWRAADARTIDSPETGRNRDYVPVRRVLAAAEAEREIRESFGDKWRRKRPSRSNCRTNGSWPSALQSRVTDLDGGELLVNPRGWRGGRAGGGDHRGRGPDNGSASAPPGISTPRCLPSVRPTTHRRPRRNRRPNLVQSLSDPACACGCTESRARPTTGPVRVSPL
jgi:hypothetical protein